MEQKTITTGKNPGKFHLLQLLLLALGLMGGSVLIGYAVQHIGFIEAFDKSVYTFMNITFPHNHFWNTIVWPFDLWFLPWKKVAWMPAFFYAYLSIFILYVAVRHRDQLPRLILGLILATYFTGLLLSFDWHFVFRERPFLHLPNTYLNEAAKHALTKWPSFPSGHVRDTVLFGTVIVAIAPETTILIVLFSIFIGITRVYTGAHFPTDVIGGWLIGYFLGVFTNLCLADIYAAYYKIRAKKKNYEPAVQKVS